MSTDKNKTEKKKTELNIQQLRVLGYASKDGYNRTITEIYKEAKVRRANHYAWIEKPDFLMAWEEATGVDNLKRNRHAVFSALITNAKAGDLPSIRLYLEITGDYVPRSKVENVFMDEFTDDTLNEEDQ